MRGVEGSLGHSLQILRKGIKEGEVPYGRSGNQTLLPLSSHA